MWKWIDKEIELDKKEIETIFKRVQDMELDCERNTVKLIKKYELNIDVQQYICEANIYLYFYSYARKNRCWFPSGVCPSDMTLLFKEMPTDLKGNRYKIPKKIYDIMDTYFK